MNMAVYLMQVYVSKEATCPWLRYRMVCKGCHSRVKVRGVDIRHRHTVHRGQALSNKTFHSSVPNFLRYSVVRAINSY